MRPRWPGPLSRDLAILVVVFAALRVVAVAGLEPVRWPDSPTYLGVDFFGGAYRLWTVPVGFRLLPGDDFRVAGQAALAVVAWSALAVAVARACRQPLVARAAALLVLLLGLTVQVTQWDLTILSESTVLSLTVLGAALALRVASPPRSKWAPVALLAVVVLWTFTRHADALALLIAFPVVAGLALWRLPRRGALIVVAALGLTWLWAGYAVSRDKRVWPGNAFLIVRHRILQDHEARRYFVARGLPLATLRAEAGRPDRVAFENPRIQAWLLGRWKPAYGSYLASRPLDTLGTPIGRAPRLESTDGGRLAYAEPRPVLPGFLQAALWGTRLWLLALAVGSLGLWLFSLRRRRPRIVEIVPWVLLALSLLWTELVWNLSATELQRLSMPGGIALRLGLLMLGAFGADRLARPMD
jgi:hypothetical protein